METAPGSHNEYRYHLIVSAADAPYARQLAVAMVGGSPEHAFLVRLHDAQGNVFYGADLMASEHLRQMMAQAQSALPSLRWFRMDAFTNELQTSTVEVELGAPWHWQSTLASCGLIPDEVEP